MLLPKMTHEEERKEILKDLPNVERWDEHRWKDIRRASLKMKDFPKYIFKEYVSPRRNRWLVSTKITGKDCFASTFGVLQILNGLVLHQIFCPVYEDRFSTVVTFLPHFFERYKQYNKLDLKGIPLIKQVLKDDISFNIDRTQEISGRKELNKDNNVHACMRMGVGLGYELGYNHYLIKTFVTYEMSRGRQKKIFEAARDDFERNIDTRPKVPPFGINSPGLLSESEIKKAIKKFGKH